MKERVGPRFEVYWYMANREGGKPPEYTFYTQAELASFLMSTVLPWVVYGHDPFEVPEGSLSPNHELSVTRLYTGQMLFTVTCRGTLGREDKQVSKTVYEDECHFEAQVFVQEQKDLVPPRT